MSKTKKIIIYLLSCYTITAVILYGYILAKGTKYDLIEVLALIAINITIINAWFVLSLIIYKVLNSLWH